MAEQTIPCVRIIGGMWRGKRLEGAAADLPTRPTSDRLRETIFNVLIHLTPPSPVPSQAATRQLGGGGGLFAVPLRVLDGFAGTGAMGLEALSRDAHSVTFVENHPHVFELLKRNVARCGADDRAQCLRANMLKFSPPTGGPFDLVLLDPPYGDGAPMTLKTLAHLKAASAIAPGTLLVVEYPAGAPLDLGPTWHLLKTTETRAARVQIAQLEGEVR